MRQLNKDKKCCRDVFHSFMLQNADYANELEIPKLKQELEVPNKLTCFSKIYQSTDYGSWVHFYEHDYIIERIWKNPERYLEQLRKYEGVILPDFSLYRDMPLMVQYYNIYRSRVVGNWLANNNIKCIVNVRFGDYRTFETACIGVPVGSTIAFGSHGIMKSRADRQVFESGLEYVLKRIKPCSIVIYGTVSEHIRELCLMSDVRLVVFESSFASSHKKSEVN